MNTAWGSDLTQQAIVMEANCSVTSKELGSLQQGEEQS